LLKRQGAKEGNLKTERTSTGKEGMKGGREGGRGGREERRNYLDVAVAPGGKDSSSSHHTLHCGPVQSGAPVFVAVEFVGA